MSKHTPFSTRLNCLIERSRQDVGHCCGGRVWGEYLPFARWAERGRVRTPEESPLIEAR